MACVISGCSRKMRAMSWNSEISQLTNETRSPPWCWRRSRTEASMFQSATTEEIPRAARFFTTRQPMKPVPPVTRNFIISFLRSVYRFRHPPAYEITARRLRRRFRSQPNVGGLPGTSDTRCHSNEYALERPPLRSQADAAQPWLLSRGRPLAGTRYRRQQRHLQLVLHRYAAPTPGGASRAARGVGPGFPERTSLGRVLGMGAV